MIEKLSKAMCCVCAIALLMGILAGCASQGTNTGTSDTNKSNVSSSNDSKSNKPAVKLVFWNAALKATDDSGQKTKDELTLYKMTKKFEEQNPGIKIEIVNQPADNFPSLFKAAGLAKNGPDIAGMWAGTFTNDYKEFLLPLDKYITDEEASKFMGIDLCRVDFKHENSIQALPCNATTYNIFYNRDLMNKAGFDPNNPPKTWDEFLTLCGKLKAAGITPVIVGDKEGYNSVWMISEFLADLVGPEGILKYGTREIKHNGPEFTKAMEAWKKLFDMGYTNKDFMSLGANDAMLKFTNGQGAMMITGSWSIGDLESALGGKLGTFRIPAISSDAPFGDYIVSQPGSNSVITNYSKHPDEAVKYLKFLHSAEFQLEYFKETGDLPANIDVKEEVLQQYHPMAAISFSWIKVGKNVIGWDAIVPADVAQEFYRLAPMVTGGKMTIEDMEKSLDHKMDQIAASNNKK